MAGRRAEMDATVELGSEMAPVATFAVEANESTAAGALAYPVLEV